MTCDDSHGALASSDLLYSQEAAMANDNWERTLREKKSDSGVLSTIMQILTLGIAEKPEVWEVEYRNRLTGEKVSGAGPSPAAAELQAKSRMEGH
jgi:hypothetical protein